MKSAVPKGPLLIDHFPYDDRYCFTNCDLLGWTHEVAGAVRGGSDLHHLDLAIGLGNGQHNIQRSIDGDRLRWISVAPRSSLPAGV